MVLPASMRLRGHRCFSRLHRSQRRHHGKLMVLRQIKRDRTLLRSELRSQHDTTYRSLAAQPSSTTPRTAHRFGGDMVVIQPPTRCRGSRTRAIARRMRQSLENCRSGTMTTIQEDVHYEGGPAKGDLILNVLLGFTLIGLPFTIGAIVRAVWLRFRITSRRISVCGGWMGNDKTQVVYSQISEVRTVPRGFGAWGDMVLVLNDGARLEMRSLPRFREVEAYILERINKRSSTSTDKSVEGFAV